MKAGISIILVFMMINSFSQGDLFRVNNKVNAVDFIPGLVLVSAFFINHQVANSTFQNKQLTKVAVGTIAITTAFTISIKLQRKQTERTIDRLLPYSGGHIVNTGYTSPPEFFVDRLTKERENLIIPDSIFTYKLKVKTSKNDKFAKIRLLTK